MAGIHHHLLLPPPQQIDIYLPEEAVEVVLEDFTVSDLLDLPPSAEDVSTGEEDLFDPLLHRVMGLDPFGTYDLESVVFRRVVGGRGHNTILHFGVLHDVLLKGRNRGEANLVYLGGHA